jgi:hypothetical protein
MAALVAAGVSAATAVSAGFGSAPSVVRVTLRSTGVTLEPSSVLAGSVVFKIANKAGKARDFSIGGRKTAAIPPGSRGTLKVRFSARPYRYVSASTAATPRFTGLLGVLPPCTSPQTTTVTVSITLNQISLSQAAVPCGTVTFAVTNTDTQDIHDLNFAFATLASGNVLGPRLQPGQSASMVVRFPYKGKVYYFCQEPEHAENGEAGFLIVR